MIHPFSAFFPLPSLLTSILKYACLLIILGRPRGPQGADQAEWRQVCGNPILRRLRGAGRALQGKQALKRRS